MYGNLKIVCLMSIVNRSKKDSSLGFERLEEEGEQFVHQHVKPDYDDGCIFMFQML